MNNKSPEINYQKLFETTPGSYLILSPDFTIVAVSDAYAKVTNTVRENILGKSLFEVFPDDPNDPKAHGVENLTASLQRVLKNKHCDTMAIQKYNIPKPASEGGGFEERYWDPQNCPILEQGEVIFIIHSVIDVTLKVHAEVNLAGKIEELEKANFNLELEKANSENVIAELNKFKLVLDNVFDKIVFTDPHDVILYANKATEKITGYTNEEVIGKSARDLWSRGLPESSYQDFWNTLIKEKKISIPEVQLQKKNGEFYTAQVNCSPILDENDNILFCVAVERDITKDKEMVSLLQLEKNKAESLVGELYKFKLAVDNAFDKVTIIDQTGIIIYANHVSGKTTGYTIEETVGKRASELWARGMPQETYQNFWNALIKEKRLSIPEVQLQKKNGEFYTALVNAFSIEDGNGNVDFCVAIERDITNEKEIDKAKSEFVSLASHQLRTPLSAINWYTEMLLAGDAGVLTDEQKNYLNEIYIGNLRMVELVNSLLNVSRLELGTLLVETEPTDIVKLARSVIGEQNPHITTKKIKFSSSFERNIPIIHIDPKLIRMVFQNLLSNAIQYTPLGGTIELSLSLDQKNNVLLKVSDTGYGIPKNQQKKIFTKLFRGDNVSANNTEGTGIGLYIVKFIVDHSGGKIWFESEENKGTTFYVTLPLK